MKLEQHLIENKVIVKNAVNGTDFLLGEETLSLLYSELESQECIIHYIKQLQTTSKKVHTPVFNSFRFTIDGENNISNDMNTGTSITLRTGEVSFINLKLAFSSTPFEMQGQALRQYVARELAQAMVDAIHFQLAQTITKLGRGEENVTYSDKWFKTFCSSHVKGNSVILVSADHVGKLRNLDPNTNGKLTIFGQPIIVCDDKSFNGIVIVNKKETTWLHDGQVKNRILDGTGFTQNLTYFNSLLASGFLITNPAHCYYATFSN